MSFILKFSFLFCLLSQTLFALESTDVIDVSVIKAYDKNILVLNRGAEDGIFKKDHIMITNKEGFIARGICIKTSMMISHWKIYRVVRPELMTKDVIYQMRSINQSELPPDLTKFAKVDFSKKYNDINDETAKKQLKLQQKRIASYDLPLKAPKDKKLEKKSKSKFEQIIENSFNKEDFIYDTNTVNIEVFASPISFQSRQEQKETHYGMSFKNYGNKYRYKVNAVEKQIRFVDPVSQKSYQSKSSRYDATFETYKVTENFSFLTYASLGREKIGSTYYPKEHTQFGPLGLRWHITENHPTNDFTDISYVPVFDTFRYDDPDIDDVESRTGIRHKLELRVFTKFSTNIQNEIIISYAPFLSQKTGELERNNTYSNIHVGFSYYFNKDVSMEYMFDYENDQFRSDTYDIKPFNLTQTFRIRYNFDL